jgi:K+-transporting ATPase ATPase B chain
MSNLNKANKLFEPALVKQALKQSFVKLNPTILFRNPVMFTVEIGTAIMLGVCLWIIAGEKNQGSLVYNILVFAILFLTLLFANFAEAIAEARRRRTACGRRGKIHLQKKYLRWERSMSAK